MIRDAVEADVPAITAIRNELIAVSTAEWRDEPYTELDRREWLSEQERRRFPVLVAVEGGEVAGVASYAAFRGGERWPGYRLTVEHSIHVGDGARGRGLGRALLDELVERARRAGLHVMVAGIDADNIGSVRFHAAAGFEVVARMPETGCKFGNWLDLILMQRLLDHRTTPGADPAVLGADEG